LYQSTTFGWGLGWIVRVVFFFWFPFGATCKLLQIQMNKKGQVWEELWKLSFGVSEIGW